MTILGNLIDNAFDATMMAIKQEGSIAPVRRVIDVSISDFGNEIIVEVEDKGCGLPKRACVRLLPKKAYQVKLKQNRCWFCRARSGLPIVIKGSWNGLITQASGPRDGAVTERRTTIIIEHGAIDWRSSWQEYNG